ncbi:MAG: class I SAM-dependent methyltransferase [Flavobacteriales bacterium]|nr:class I SAM-dependent methyltransferase [Flavobacteriales bacterium]
MSNTKKYSDDFVAELVELYKKQLAALRAVKLSTNVPGISHQHVVPQATYAPWLDHAAFQQAYELARHNTLVDIQRCFELWQLVERGRHVPGNILEVGVWRGGTGSLMAKAAQLYSPGTRVFLADTFKGVVKAGTNDTNYKGGEHADTTQEVVRTLLGSQGVDNTELLVGIYPDEIDRTIFGDTPIKLCHIDVDTYDSAKDIFDEVWPRMARGGAVVFDDYGFWGCEGVTRLCDSIDLPDARFVHNLNGHALFFKL